MPRSDPTLKRWYNRINKKFFLNELPSNVLVRWAKSITIEGIHSDEIVYGVTGRAMGRHCYEIILVHQKTIHGELNTLAHEMIHIATEMRDDHGPVFEEWRRKLGDRGFFRKGAVLRGMTMF